MSRSTGRIRLTIQFMSRRENWFISSSPITLAPLRSFLSAAVHHAADWTPALLLAAQSDRALVVSGYLTLFQRPVVLGLALVGCSPSPCCPSRQWSFQDPRGRLPRSAGSRQIVQPRSSIPIHCGGMRRSTGARDQLRAEDRRRLRSIPAHRRVRARCAVDQCQPLRA